jgi:hypothetical protein
MSALMQASTDTLRASLRESHRVRLVEPREEGTAAEQLPRGTFGFTGSPALASPLFRERRYRNFEVHHLADGSVALIGFVTEDEARCLGSSHDVVDVTMYPDAAGESQTVVAVPYSRIVHHRQYSVLNSASIALRVRPLSAGVEA